MCACMPVNECVSVSVCVSMSVCVSVSVCVHASARVASFRVFSALSVSREADVMFSFSCNVIILIYVCVCMHSCVSCWRRKLMSSVGSTGATWLTKSRLN